MSFAIKGTAAETPLRRRGSKSPTKSRRGESNGDLVYRHLRHKPTQLIFAPRERAFHVHLIWTAIKGAKTWGQFIDMLPSQEWAKLGCLLEERPRRQDKFSAESLPGYSDGDYPPWLQTEVGRCIPAIALEEFGLREASAINGQFWEIPAEIEHALVDRLRHLGLAVELRDDWDFL